MEPRKQVLTKSPEERKEATKSRFQILKLEQRIAPHCGVHRHLQNSFRHYRRCL